MLTAICVVELVASCVAFFALMILRSANKVYVVRLAEMESEYEAFGESHRSSVRHYEQRIDELNKLITDETEAVDNETPSPATTDSLPLPESATNLIQRLKLRHNARIAAYDFEQRKQDEANRKLGQMYRELQCSTGQVISTLRTQLATKLRVKCPVCTHLYQAPEPVVRVKKSKGVIQSVPAVKKKAPKNGQVNRSSSKRNTD